MSNKSSNTCNGFKIMLDIIYKQEDEHVVSFCPALDVSGYGYSVNEAKKSFHIELKIFLEETTKHGTFERYLLEKGWTLKRIPKPSYIPPVFDLSKNKNMLKASIDITRERVCLPV